MIPGQSPLSSLRFADRNTVFFRETAQGVAAALAIAGRQPPPQTIIGWRALLRSAAASANWVVSAVRRNSTMRSAKKDSGQSAAVACTSRVARVTGPHWAGSVSTAMARGSAVSNWCGETMRSK